MSPLKVLIDLGLMCWPVVFLGFRKGWVRRKDVFEYAVSLLVGGNKNEDVAVIAGGEYLGDDELLTLVSKQIERSDYAFDLDKWRLAFLLCIDGSDDCEQDKINRLQKVYADFDYPEDMASCSVYSQDDVCPLVAMRQVVKELQEKFLLR